ncbi:hypothetical protein CEXT_692581 [Caerostris extrusa]|uniref:Uncharacterized protein n=1 Tax=Caerostris extrusa TaxID=172846 RepID=A0AAV4W1I8_CAEEX|nr:hypothetical protein CEXT_692581 [Caerostris extrusa]
MGHSNYPDSVPFQCVFTAAKESFVKEQHSHNQYGLGPIFFFALSLCRFYLPRQNRPRLSDQANRLIMYGVSSGMFSLAGEGFLM